MQSKVKLTKRQVKEDKFTTFMLTARERFEENWQFYAIGLVVLLLAVSAVAYYFNNMAAREAEAGDKFARAFLDHQNGDEQIAILGFTQIIEEYGTSAPAGNATYLLGEINLNSRNYGDSKAYFEQYLQNFTDNPLYRGAAHAGIAAVLENQGNYAEAAAAFDRASLEYPDGPLDGDYVFGAMRNFLQTGEVESAQAHLDILKEKYPNTIHTRRAIRLFAEKGNI